MNKVVVAIVDKQALFRVGVRYALSQQPDFEVFGVAPPSVKDRRCKP